MTFTVVGSYLLEVKMNKYEIAKLKKDLLKKKSHDILRMCKQYLTFHILSGIWIYALNVGKYAPKNQKSLKMIYRIKLSSYASYKKTVGVKTNRSFLFQSFSRLGVYVDNPKSVALGVVIV